MAKKLIPVFTVFALVVAAFGATTSAALACEIDGFPAGFVPGGGEELLGYSASGEQPKGGAPADSPSILTPAPAGSSTSVGMLLVLGLALLAAPLYATVTVVSARLNQRR